MYIGALVQNLEPSSHFWVNRAIHPKVSQMLQNFNTSSPCALQTHPCNHCTTCTSNAPSELRKTISQSLPYPTCMKSQNPSPSCNNHSKGFPSTYTTCVLTCMSVLMHMRWIARFTPNTPCYIRNLSTVPPGHHKHPCIIVAQSLYQISWSKSKNLSRSVKLDFAYKPKWKLGFSCNNTRNESNKP